MTKSKWGPWTVNLDTACIEYARNDREYYVEIEKLVDTAGILDWILHLSAKRWTSAADVGYLVEAIEEILGRDVASCGVDHKIDPIALLDEAYGVESS